MVKGLFLEAESAPLWVIFLFWQSKAYIWSHDLPCPIKCLKYGVPSQPILWEWPLFVVFIYQTWRHFSGSFSANNPYLLKSGRSAVFGGEICRYMRDNVWRMVRQYRFFLKLTIWRHNMLIIIRHDFFLIILTFNLKLDTRFVWGGFK